MKKNVIVSFANSQSNYMLSLARLSHSLKYNFDGDFMAFVGEHTLPGCPSHEETPYAFKLYAIQAARDVGYKNILWLDSSCFAVQPLSPIFDHIEEYGYIMQDAGHFVGVWSNDNCLRYFDLDRDVAMNLRCYGNAGFLGLNFEKQIANTFFNLWRDSMNAGVFCGKWNNDKKTESQDERVRGHRHDLVAGSIIANKLGMEYQSSQEWLQYAGPYDQRLNDKIYICAQGL
jgi:hypothetical protein